MDKHNNTGLPTNPYCRREYATSTEDGKAWLSLPAPGGRISPDDACYLIEWLQFVIRQLERFAEHEDIESLKVERDSYKEMWENTDEGKSNVARINRMAESFKRAGSEPATT